MLKNKKRKIVIGGIYRHFKGDLYKVIEVAIDVRTNEKLVIFTALHGLFFTWAKPIEDFLSVIDKEKYHSVNQEYCYELVDEGK